MSEVLHIVDRKIRLLYIYEQWNYKRFLKWFIDPVHFQSVTQTFNLLTEQLSGGGGGCLHI
jgi:hypothetical protein